METTNEILRIIADEAGVANDELVDESEFRDLGIDNILAKCIISRIREELDLELSPTFFIDNATVADLKINLGKRLPLNCMASNNQPAPPVTERSRPLSLVLQGTKETCSRRIFLLPDGSGSGMAYARLPRIGPDICLIALNSPYLQLGSFTTFRMKDVAEIWADEIQLHQPHGPYLVGGWSAGGYYAFEVAKRLIAKEERVEKLVLIDSPCRLEYEALPISVVQYLSRNNLMGNWGSKSPPGWLIDHFDITISAIQRYMPTEMNGPHNPDVFIIWAKEGIIHDRNTSKIELDMNVKVTRMLIERPKSSGALGWDKLFPSSRLRVAEMPGNHFTLVYPPNVSSFFDNYRDT
ncbi:uncharacterized protein PV09_01421 [Verruconis gallopava]|uniref:Carrier domain-containing protein n=1 Tax=Verruconis gallopava TaxID=253628 RepID=A0A0D1Z6H3_9PEZI|nr:uncharacterized protein PV09_01421 [Verruconis gallopava]KIW08532.1 hypothetical protein PV09_01421 [Verruconis gallopava]